MGAMQIRISEMLDNASELIEENSKDGYMVDNDRIKEIVFSEIKYMRRKHKKKKCAVALIAILGLGSISVGAKVLLHSAGVIDNNRKEVMQSQTARKIDEDKVYTFDYKSGLQTDLIAPENLYEKDVPIAKYIVEIPISIEDSLPECYLDNGAMIIFTQSNSDGWKVEKSERMLFEFIQERVEGTDMANPGILEDGYILNGELQGRQVVSQNYCSIDFCLASEGTYYFYLKNCSSDRIIITRGNIGKTQEE